MRYVADKNLTDYENLLAASSHATNTRMQIERLLLKTRAGTLESMFIYAEFKAAETRELELRSFVRHHPDHNYEGL